MAMDKYKIREICGDWALDIKMGETTVALYFNSRNNAEMVKAILEWEDAHPNKAVPYKPTITPPNEQLMPDELKEMGGKPVWTVGVSYTDDGKWAMWDIVEKADDEGVDFGYSTESREWWNYNLRDKDGKLLNCAWVCYRRPTEGEEDV